MMIVASRRVACSINNSFQFSIFDTFIYAFYLEYFWIPNPFLPLNLPRNMSLRYGYDMNLARGEYVISESVFIVHTHTQCRDILLSLFKTSCACAYGNKYYQRKIPHYLSEVKFARRFHYQLQIRWKSSKAMKIYRILGGSSGKCPSYKQNQKKMIEWVILVSAGHQTSPSHIKVIVFAAASKHKRSECREILFFQSNRQIFPM